MNRRRLLRRLMDGHRNNVRFADFVDLIVGFGFEEMRSRGSHHLFDHPRIPDQLNVQSKKGQAKPYQIRQLLDAVERYDLRLEDE